MHSAMHPAASAWQAPVQFRTGQTFDSSCAAGTWLRTVYVEYGDAASLLVRISPNYYTGGLALGEFIARACLPVIACSIP